MVQGFCELVDLEDEEKLQSTVFDDEADELVEGAAMHDEAVQAAQQDGDL